MPGRDGDSALPTVVSEAAREDLVSQTDCCISKECMKDSCNEGRYS